MPPLRAIVYVSTSHTLLGEHELESLLKAARGFNHLHGVTGVLLYSAGDFIQCIEGADHDVALVYKRIRASRMHGGIVELTNESVEERAFSGWDMGFRAATNSEMLALSAARWQKQVDAAAGANRESSGMYLLKDFWSRTR